MESLCKKLGITICAVLFIAGVMAALFSTKSIGNQNKAIQTISYTKSIQAAKKKQVAGQDQGNQASLPITAKSAVLIENSSGRILYEKDKDKEVIPASITKIMTLHLIFDALDEHKISLKDSVTVSDYAAKMGGSQVFLEPGETQTVKDMIKCISIASANDAAVAMAEYVAGSEQEFVKRMNAKAKELGMRHTRFKNCNGLDDTIKSGHYSSAYDVALMSQALVTRHPDITKYSTVWMDEITHKTKKGESVFGLTNTNKLIRTYDGITGLKTGSTSKAKYCLSATAKRGGVSLTAVVMAAPDHKGRRPFKRATRQGRYEDKNRIPCGKRLLHHPGGRGKARGPHSKNRLPQESDRPCQGGGGHRFRHLPDGGKNHR